MQALDVGTLQRQSRSSKRSGEVQVTQAPASPESRLAKRPLMTHLTRDMLSVCARTAVQRAATSSPAMRRYQRGLSRAYGQGCDAGG